MKAMILAAGFGTRLFPLTIDRTKPAIPFLGKPLVGYVAEYLAKFGFNDIIVNLHHQPESVKKALGDGSDFGVNVQYTVEEPKILGTSGALDNARKYLENETFLVANGKIITDIDIKAALETHRKSNALATMILKENSSFEKFTEVNVDDGFITGFETGFPDAGQKNQPNVNTPMMYTGIQILEPRVFDYIPKGIYSDIVPTFYKPAIKNGEKIAAHIAQGKWFELSTIHRYLESSLHMLNGIENKLIIGTECDIGQAAEVENSVIWDNVTIENGATLSNTIVCDDVVIKKGETYKNAAIVKGMMLDNCDEIPQKALQGTMVGENYVVQLD